MKKGFNIVCQEYNEKMTLNEVSLKDKDDSKISSTVLGAYPFHTLLLVCSSCGNEIEVEV